MDTQHYEAMLKKHPGGGKSAEASWDSRAKTFGMQQKLHGMDNSGEVTSFLLKKGLLEGADVLDVGGGTGRYAIPFAAHAREVTVTDISAQMLECTKENAEAAGRSNLRYEKLNWEEAELRALGWEKRFGLVFASMCPAVRSKAGIDKMSAASGGWCHINQLIEMTDNISRKLAQELEVEKQYDPHNDRDALQGTFNLLWLKGYEPEIAYLREAGQQLLTVDEALSRYSRRFGAAAELKGADLKRLLEGYSQGGRVAVDNGTTLAMLLWKA